MNSGTAGVNVTFPAACVSFPAISVAPSNNLMFFDVTVATASGSLNVITTSVAGSAFFALSVGETAVTVGGALPGWQAPFASQVSSPSFGSPFEQSAATWQPSQSIVPPAPALAPGI